MSSKILRISKFISPTRSASPILSTQFQYHSRKFTSTQRNMAPLIVDSNFLSQITAAEKLITNKDDPVQGGPTAKAQSHVGQQVSSQVLHDITMGERHITGKDTAIQNGPTAVAQSLYAAASGQTNQSIDPNQVTTGNSGGVMDGSVISKISAVEKDITGETSQVKGGPAANAQAHAGEPIGQALHDITEGEKTITGGERVKGGPTSTAQSELAKSRQ